MDKQKAKQELRTLRDSISEVLGENSNKANSSDIKESIEQAQESARAGAKALKKSLIERIKDLPVVTQVSQLGAAGTVAVSTAAVTQVDIAQDRTEIFVAEVAQDVIEERFEVPEFIDNFVDFATLNDWGQQVITEKISEAQAFVAEVSEPPQTSPSAGESSDTTQETSVSSQSESSEKSSQTSEPSQAEQSKESETEKQESKEGNSSSEPTEEAEEVKSNDDTQEETKEPTEQSEAKSDAIPIVKTPYEPMDNDISPHSNIRQVSPTS
tara:strand:+ start:764 stop:1570 length:807 start_codon:yes stop_codon:yes gene_type:complete